METIQKINPTDWKNLVAKYQSSQKWKSIWQLSNSLIPFILCWYAMYLSLEVSYWLTLLLAIPAAGFQVRIFIFQHDCGHGSFFKSKKANNWTGLLCSFITWTPYFYWRKGHGIHHASAGNLESRGIGDVYTMTVNEYLQRSKWGRLKYRLYRHPLFLFFFIPAIIFVLWYRFPTSRNKVFKKVQSNVYWTDLAIFIIVGTLIWLVGVKAYLMIQLPIVFLAASAGNWLFYVQHQFEDTYWADKNNWDFSLAAMHGSSYYKLPKVFQWFTGNIGFHHIHHLSPVIPNYMLEKCYKNNPIFQKVITLNLQSSLKSIYLNLWDEEQKKLICFRDLKRISRQQLTTSA